MQCPKCKADIDADSWYCDQCGEELMMCPKCNAPRKGKRCTQCGTLLVAAKDFTPGAPATGTPPPPQTPAGGSTAAPQTPTGGPSGSPQRPVGGPTGAPQRPVGGPTGGQTPPPFSGASTPPQRPVGGPSGGATPPPAGGTMRPQAQGPSRMVCIDNPQLVVTFRNGALIGRTQGDYLAVFSGNGYCSGRHATISQQGADWYIMDVGSTNGTRVDGRQITPNQPFKLAAGQTIEIGNQKFKVQ